MFEEDFVEEVRHLINKGYTDSPQMKSMGYYEVVKYIEREHTLEETISKVKQKHRNYAKRQATWFENQNRNYNLKRFNFITEKEQIFGSIKDFLKNG